MSERPVIYRYLPTPFRERVEVPHGHKVCGSCKGNGQLSKYDEGWSSLVHDAELAALHPCIRCGGQGYVVDHE